MNLRRLADPALAAGVGVAMGLGMPPDGLPLLTAAALALLAWRLPDQSPRRAATLVWLSFTLWHLVTTAWIGQSFSVVMPAFAPYTALPILGLSIVTAAFAAVAVYIWRRFWPGADRVSGPAFLALAVALSLAEWALGHIATGLPWTTMSLAVADTWLAQNVSGFGAYGLGLTVLAATLTLVGAIHACAFAKQFIRREIAIAAFAVGLMLAPWPRLMSLESQSASTVIDLNWPIIRLVQGNTPQREKWKVDNRATIFARHMSLSTAPAEQPLTAIVWPETATPFRTLESGAAMAALGAIAPAGGYVILGAPASLPSIDGKRRSTNSLIAVDDTGVEVSRYDKSHLVPFGEYMPFEDYLPLDKMVAGRGSFVPGAGIRTIKLPGLPAFSPLICYEVIFPGAVALKGVDRPAFLLNVTNDAWYGVSAGPHQHLAIARLRAIEEGLPLIRVANTGISAAFDGAGKELGRIPLEETGFLDVALPPPLPPTLYARYGDAIYFGMLVLCFGIAHVVRRRS